MEKKKKKRGWFFPQTNHTNVTIITRDTTIHPSKRQALLSAEKTVFSDPSHVQ